MAIKKEFYIEPSAHVLCVGMTGSGKSFLAEEFLKGYDNVIKLDTKQETDERYAKGESPWRGLEEGEDFEVCYSLEECQRSNFNKIIYCVPFEEQNEDTFNDFFSWVYQRQNTIIWIDELMSIGTARRYPAQLHRVMVMGRSKNVGVWSCTQRPQSIPVIVPANCKYFFVFCLADEDDRKSLVRSTGFPELKHMPGDIEDHEFWFVKLGNRRAIKAVLK